MGADQGRQMTCLGHGRTSSTSVTIITSGRYGGIVFRIERVRGFVVISVISVAMLGLGALPAQATAAMQDLGTLGGSISGATAVSGDIVVGSAHTDGGAEQHAFAFDLSTDTIQDLGTLGGAF